MLHELFNQQRQHINYFFDHIDLKKAEEILQKLLSCRGIVFFTGIGKSGLVAKKVAVTMTSMGTRALYLSPTNALHGDIGIVNPDDLLVIISKSGESDELLNLLPSLRNKGVYILSIVCKENSRLAELSDDSILLPLEKELGIHNLMPTTSTTIQMTFGDILSVALMQAKGVQLEDYQQNHPAGRIGRRLLLKVQDLMITDDRIPKCKADDFIVNTLVELSNKQCGCLLVVDDDNHLMGIFTDGDLRRALQTEGAGALNHPVSAFMTTTPRVTHPETLAAAAMKTMEEKLKNPITVLAVVDNGSNKVVGILKLHDIIQSGI